MAVRTRHEGRHASRGQGYDRDGVYFALTRLADIRRDLLSRHANTGMLRTLPLGDRAPRLMSPSRVLRTSRAPTLTRRRYLAAFRSQSRMVRPQAHCSCNRIDLVVSDIRESELLEFCKHAVCVDLVSRVQRRPSRVAGSRVSRIARGNGHCCITVRHS
jgi:hypothetical protein